MTAADLDAVAAIGRASMAHPWPWSHFVTEMAADRGIRLVADEHGLAGYAVFRYVLDEGELLQVAVAVDRRGWGLGGALLRRGHDLLAVQGVRRCHLEVRRRNRRARSLYRRLGYHRTGLRPGYYRQPVDDAVLMTIILQGGKSDEDHSRP